MFTIAWSFDLFWSVWLIKTENDAIRRMHRIHAETKSTDYRKCNNEREVADEMRKKTKTYTQNSPIPSQRKEINSFYHECAKWNFRSLNRNDSGKNRKPIATFLHSSPATNQDSDNLFWKLITLFQCCYFRNQRFQMKFSRRNNRNCWNYRNCYVQSDFSLWKIAQKTRTGYIFLFILQPTKMSIANMQLCIHILWKLCTSYLQKKIMMMVGSCVL